MEIVKRNLLSIICGVVALIAVVSIFFPLEGFYNDLAAKLAKSKADEEAIKTQSTAEFKLPIIEPDKTEAPPFPEGAYPYRQVIDEGKQLVAELSKQANQLVDFSRKFNKHAALVERALPAGGGSERSTFKNAYYYKFEEFKQRLNLVAPPNEADFQAAKDELWDKEWKGKIQLGAGGQPINQQEVEAEFEKVTAKLPDAIKRDRAMKASMYLAGDRPLRRPAERPVDGGGRNFGRSGGGFAGAADTGFTSFDYHAGIPPLESGDLPDPVNIWMAQLSLWIQEDIVNAIDETNRPKDANGRQAAAPNVENAIVKRLVRIAIPKDYVTRTGTLQIAQALQQQAQATPGVPTDATTEDPNAATKSYNTTPTGRVNNPVYDVMHFQVVVDVDAREFRRFMANLARKRFVTVLKADAKAVDRERALQFNYYYGPAPVVQLTLRCEAIFFRDWTLPLMPKEIKTLLQIPDPSQQPVSQ
jgi:hypothetical protein